MIWYTCSDITSTCVCTSDRLPHINIDRLPHINIVHVHCIYHHVLERAWHGLLAVFPTGWSRPIGCLIFKDCGRFPQKSTTISGPLAGNDLQLKASTGLSAPCRLFSFVWMSHVLRVDLVDYSHSCEWVMSRVWMSSSEDIFVSDRWTSFEEHIWYGEATVSRID